MATKRATKKTTGKPVGNQASEESGVRWKTFNAFAEHVMPHLPGAVVKVWSYLFFRAYRNVVKLSERNLAAAAGVNKDTAGLALRMLVTTGLARVNYKSKAEGAPSEYWLNPRPASCLESVVALKAKKPDGRKGNRHPNRRKKPPGVFGITARKIPTRTRYKQVLTASLGVGGSLRARKRRTIMASLTTFKDGPRAGTHRIVMKLSSGRRATLYLGRMEVETAETIRDRIKAILTCRKAGDDLSRSLAAWVDSLADGFHEKLAKLGLVATRTAATRQTVSGLIDAFLARAGHVKPSTRASYKQTTDSLNAFLGASTSLEEVTAERADAWRGHIVVDEEGTTKARVAKNNRLAPATVAKRVMVAKTIFGRAVRWGWLQKSPFDHLKAGSQANPGRAFYVSLEATEKILDKCPSLDWKLVVGLGRYAGLRVPSEIVGMTWDDVLWDSGRLVVRPSKTAGHEGHEVRVVPICPELREILNQAHEAARDGDKWVVPSLRSASKNMRTTFTRIITRAGLKPWPRLFQNLRSSRATDWVEVYPSHIVAAWLGHSTAIAAAHYLQVRDHHFDAVVAGDGIHATRHATRARPVKGSRDPVAIPQAESLESLEDEIEAVLTSQGVAASRVLNIGIVGDTGLEPVTPSLSS